MERCMMNMLRYRISRRIPLRTCNVHSSAATQVEPSAIILRRVPPSSDEHDILRGAGWVAIGSTAFAAAEFQRRRSVRCASLRRVRLGKVEEFQESTMTEVALAPDRSNATVLLHRHGDVFYATSPSCYHCGSMMKGAVSASGGRGGPATLSFVNDATFDLKSGSPVRGPALDGIATYRVEVVGDSVFAHIPSEVVDGKGDHQKPLLAKVRRSPRDRRVFVLVGGGPASVAAAETLRREGYLGRILMITDEPHLPYERTVLSKKFNSDFAELQLRTAEHYKQLDVEIKHGTVVTKLDASQKQVCFKALGGEEETLTYDSVLVASGSSPRTITCPGSTLKGVYNLRKQEDVTKIAQHARKGQKMIIVGGSFIGMEIASTLRAKGCDVSIVAMESVPFELVLGRQIGLAFARLLQKEGVSWYGGARVRNIRGKEELVNGVELEDGEVLPADAIIVGVGAQPNTHFVNGVSLDKAGGILVGPLLCSADAPSLFAAGDVCVYPSEADGATMRSEHWNVAIQQGRAAARNMLSKSEPYSTLPFFTSQLFGKTLSFVGHAPDLNQVIVEGDVSAMEFVAYFFDKDDVKAVATVNKANTDSMAAICAETMRRGHMPKVHEIMIGVVNAEVILQRLQALR